jgi:hypothetical protein
LGETIWGRMFIETVGSFHVFMENVTLICVAIRSDIFRERKTNKPTSIVFSLFKEFIPAQKTEVRSLYLVRR